VVGIRRISEPVEQRVDPVWLWLAALPPGDMGEKDVREQFCALFGKQSRQRAQPDCE